MNSFIIICIAPKVANAKLQNKIFVIKHITIILLSSAHPKLSDSLQNQYRLDAMGIFKQKFMHKVLVPSIITPHINSYGLMEALDAFMCLWLVKC